MTEAAGMQHRHHHQEAPAIAYVYSLGTHPGQVVPVDPVNNIFHEDNNQTDWKSFFKHPPSNIRFTRNPSSGSRDSKRAVKIPPCTTTTTTSSITSEQTREKPLPKILKVPPPPPKSVTVTKKLASRKTSEEPYLGGDVPPSSAGALAVVVNHSATDRNGGQQQQKQLHDHSGSAGESTSESTSTSPTSQISNGAMEDGNGEEDHEVFSNEDEVTTVIDTNNDTGSHNESSRDYFGQCCACGLAVCESDSGCVADDRLYHNKCFMCQKCGHNLVSESFYVVQHEVLCRKDYLLTLDKCFSCNEPVTDQVIHANDHAYHLSCFKCTDCGLCLDGIPYAIDCSDKVYCVKDYHRAFAPRCQTCEEPILPNEAEPNTKRLIAMNMNFHVGCYCCVECGISLVSADESAPQCFPIDQYPLCLECNRTWAIRRHSAQNSPAVTEQSSLSEQSIS